MGLIFKVLNVPKVDIWTFKNFEMRNLTCLAPSESDYSVISEERNLYLHKAPTYDILMECEYLFTNYHFFLMAAEIA